MPPTPGPADRPRRRRLAGERARPVAGRPRESAAPVATREPAPTVTPTPPPPSTPDLAPAAPKPAGPGLRQRAGGVLDRFAGAGEGIGIAIPIAAAVVVALLVTLILQFLSWRSGEAVVHARKDATTAAAKAVDAALTYNYRTFDSDVSRADKLLTPQFRKSYDDTQQHSVKATAVHYQASSAADVIGAGIVSTNGSRASVLLFVDQTVRNSKLPAPRIDKSRVIADMHKVGGHWLCANIRPL
jgi:Mce-associated membrane protein